MDVFFTALAGLEPATLALTVRRSTN
ncbi:hypothetical protein WVIC16_60051 [Weissella viridescens]|nr:hypothetical protein WVIC16_60051 [Weissella viridescens]